MKFKIHIENQADREIRQMTKYSRKKELEKLFSILNELEDHPKTGTGKPEQLRYDLAGFWSRRLNRKDRIIYEIDEDEAVVTVLSVLGHY